MPAGTKLLLLLPLLLRLSRLAAAGEWWMVVASIIQLLACVRNVPLAAAAAPTRSPKYSLDSTFWNRTVPCAGRMVRAPGFQRERRWAGAFDKCNMLEKARDVCTLARFGHAFACSHAARVHARMLRSLSQMKESPPSCCLAHLGCDEREQGRRLGRHQCRAQGVSGERWGTQPPNIGWQGPLCTHAGAAARLPLLLLRPSRTSRLCGRVPQHDEWGTAWVAAAQLLAREGEHLPLLLPLLLLPLATTTHGGPGLGAAGRQLLLRGHGGCCGGVWPAAPAAHALRRGGKERQLRGCAQNDPGARIHPRAPLRKARRVLARAEHTQLLHGLLANTDHGEGE